MKQYENYEKSPNFYADIGRFLMESGETELGRRILSNLAEMDLENPQLLRMLAFLLDDPALVISIFKQVLSIRPEEPQSYRDLALSLINYGNSQMKSLADTSFLDPTFQKISEVYMEAISLLNKVINNEKGWDVRFAQIEVIALTDLMRVFQQCDNHNFVFLKDQVDKRFAIDMDVDLRIVIQWDTDMTDVELLVMEPNGELCYSFNNKTSNQGIMSRNYTNGYGPQEYLVRQALPGEYKVAVRLFASPERFGTTVCVKIWTNFGRPLKEREATCFVRLTTPKQFETVAKIFFY